MTESQAVQLRVNLWHPDGQQVALQAGQWPQLSAKPGDDLSKRVRESWGIDFWLLHEGGFSLGKTGLVHLQALAENLPPDWAWENLEVPPIPKARAWQQPGWPNRVERLLQLAGIPASSAIQQVFSTDLNTVLKVPTQHGDAYLKVSASPQEARVTDYLAKHLPELLPPLLAADTSAGWQISAAGRELLDSVGDLSTWTQAIERLAQFQTSADVTALTKLGCPAYPLGEMTERVDALLGDTKTLQGWGLAAPHLAPLQEARPLMRRAFAALAELGLPDLPAHGDAHPRNALSGAGGSVWFDWSETAAQAHPFMDLGWFLAFTFHPRRENLAIRQAHSALEGILTRHYLKVLGCPEAEALLRSAIPLALLHRAAIYNQQFRHWEGTIPGWRPNYTPYYLRLAAGELPRLTS